MIENVRTMPRASRDGSLVYIPTRGESDARLVWVDRAGRPTAVEGQRLDYTHLDDALECSNGQACDRSRVKFASVEEMLAALGRASTY